tara:strand:+ start:2058 stop:2447 length:390 start_codon:yes stop_codon:yes gene_type:complete
MSYQSALQTLQWSTHLEIEEEGTIYKDGLDYEPSQELKDRIKKDWDSFINKALEMGFDPDNDILNYGDYYENDVWELAAHDFILTRNGHGAGFSDGDWSEPMATKLTELCKKFGEINIYLSDENLLEAY